MKRTSQNRIGVFLAACLAIGLLLAEDANGGSIFWTDEHGVHRCDLDGQNHQNIVPIQIPSIIDMAIDEVDEKIYYADFYGKRILRSDLDGEYLENMVTSGLWNLTSLVVDSSRRKVYWIDSFSIFRANLDGTDIEKIVESWEPHSLAIDDKSGKIYWLYRYPKNRPMLGRANLDGSDKEEVIVWGKDIKPHEPVFSPTAIAIDSNEERIYFVRDRAVQRANMDGSNIEIMLKLEFEKRESSVHFLVDAKGKQLFWTDSLAGAIYRATLDGDNVDTIVRQGRIGAITLHSTDGKIYWADDLHNTTVYRANLDGSGHEVVTDASSTTYIGIDVDKHTGKVYWTGLRKRQSLDRGEILRANQDGTAVELLITAGLENPTAVALDGIGKWIYWVDNDSEKISRANLDGRNVEDVVIGTTSWITDIEVDTESNKIYWIDPNHGIHRANLNGTMVELLVGSIEGARGLGISTRGGKIFYWINAGGVSRNTIRMAALDGTNLETSGRVNSTGHWYDLDVDDIDQKIYWTNWQNGLIERANFDGTYRKTIVFDPVKPKYIALDVSLDSVPVVEVNELEVVPWGHIRQNLLSQNYPNPFNLGTWIPYSLATPSEVTITIHHLYGLTVIGNWH